MPRVLRARALWKSYAAGIAGCSARVWVLRGASLDVERGECVAVIGAHGAGTTTLLHCLAGLRRIDAGTVELSGRMRFVAATPCGAGLERYDRLLLQDDDPPRARWRGDGVADSRAGDHTAVVLAAHALAPVREVADRVLLLRDGRLLSVDRAAGVRRVAERRPESSRDMERPATAPQPGATSGRRGRARPGTAHG